MLFFFRHRRSYALTSCLIRPFLLLFEFPLLFLSYCPQLLLDSAMSSGDYQTTYCACLYCELKSTFIARISVWEIYGTRDLYEKY